MTTALHKDLPIDEIHAPVSFQYADQATREAATGFTSSDVNKFARQIDDNSLWMLISISPVTWVAIGNGGGSGGSGYLFVTAIKGTAGTIPAGSPVYVTGCGTYPQIEKAKADSSSTMPAIGLTAAEITDSVEGLVILRGQLTGVDTSAWTSLDKLYVSAATAGALTKDRPTGSALIQHIAEAVKIDATAGIYCVHGPGVANDLPNLSENKMWVGDSDGHPVEKDALFGQNAQNAESESQSSHTGNTDWQQKLRLTTPSLPIGKYRIGWNYEWNYDDAAAAFIGVKVEVNDGSPIHEIYQEPQDTDNWYQQGGFDYYDVASPAILNIDLDYKTYNALATAYIRKARLEIWRVPS